MALSAWAPTRIAVDARYYAAGYGGALPDCYARDTVAHRLVTAAERLPRGWRFVVFDAWRPLIVQQQLFESYLARLRAVKASATEAELRQQAARYVAPPSTDLACPSPHATGCVLDLSLLGPDGVALDMGTEFDAFDARAHTRYFERRLETGVQQTRAEEVCRRRRRILFHALRSVGFVNYADEWWHFEYRRERYGPLLGLGDSAVG